MGHLSNYFEAGGFLIAAIAILVVGRQLAGGRITCKKDDDVHFGGLSTGVILSAVGVLGLAIAPLREIVQQPDLAAEFSKYGTFGSLSLIWLGMVIYAFAFMSSGDKKNSWPMKLTTLTVLAAGGCFVVGAGLNAFMTDAPSTLPNQMMLWSGLVFGGLVILIGLYYSWKRC